MASILTPDPSSSSVGIKYDQIYVSSWALPHDFEGADYKTNICFDLDPCSNLVRTQTIIMSEY